MIPARNALKEGFSAISVMDDNSATLSLGVKKNFQVFNLLIHGGHGNKWRILLKLTWIPDAEKNIIKNWKCVMF